jgi:proteasome lid subunit RPN8/RPN11
MLRGMKNRIPKRRRSPTRPASLRFTPTAWAKLLYLRDAGDTEVGGFGISHPEDLLLVEDVILVQQICTTVSVAFADTSVAEFFDDQIDAGRRPEQCGRIWIHTHPGDSAMPSSVDEETFRRVFGRSDWAVMAILACGGQSYARIRFSAGPGGEQQLPVEVDYQRAFPAADHLAWEREHRTCVQQAKSGSILDGLDFFNDRTEFYPDDFDFRELVDPLFQ